MQTKKRIVVIMIALHCVGIMDVYLGSLEISRSGPWAQTVRVACSTTMELTALLLVCRHWCRLSLVVCFYLQQYHFVLSDPNGSFVISRYPVWGLQFVCCS